MSKSEAQRTKAGQEAEAAALTAGLETLLQEAKEKTMGLCATLGIDPADPRLVRTTGAWGMDKEEEEARGCGACHTHNGGIHALISFFPTDWSTARGLAMLLCNEKVVVVGEERVKALKSKLGGLKGE